MNIKKLLLLTLILCLVLPCFGCDTPDTPPAGDDSTDETTTEETTEEVTTEDKYEEILDHRFRNEEEYQELLKYKYLREDFVTKEDVACIGDFRSLNLGDPFAPKPSETYMDYYEYRLNADGITPRLIIMHRDDLRINLYIPPEERNSKDAHALPQKPTTDMRFYNGVEGLLPEYTGNVWVGDIQYFYSYGYLAEIIWKVDDIIFQLTNPGHTGSTNLFDTRSDNSVSFLLELLNAETAEAAIARFAAKLKGSIL